MKKTAVFLSALIFALAVLAGCGEKQAKTDLVVYTSESQDLVTDMLEAFVEKNPDISYTLFRSGTGKVTAKVDTEREAGSVDADVLWIADLAYLTRLDGEGLLHHYVSPAMERLDGRFCYQDGMATEVRQIFNIIAYNTAECAAPPADWKDLAKPELRGRIAMANPGYSGGALTTVVTHMGCENLGFGLYRDLIANDLKLEESNGNLKTKVSAGEYAAVSMVDFMARNAEREGSPVATVWPESGAVMVPTPVAILEKGDDPEKTAAAERLVDFLLSEDAQKLFVEQGYLPVSETAGSPEGAPAVKDIVTCPLNLDFFLERSADVRDVFQRMYDEK